MITKVLNPGQNVNNAFSVTNDGSPCNGDSATICKHTVTFPRAETFVSFTVFNNRTGANELFPITGEVRQSIAATLDSIGYNVSGVDSFYLEDDGTNIIFGLIGDLTLVNVITSVGTKTPVVTCTKALVCNYVFNYAGNVDPAVSTFSIDGTETTFADPLVWGVDNAAAVKAAFNTPALAGGALKVTVTLDSENEKYVVTIRAVSGTILLIDDEEFERSDCWVDYLA